MPKNYHAVDVGNRMRRARERLDWSLTTAGVMSAKMAAAGQCDRAYGSPVIGSYERADREMPLSRIFDFALLYGVSASWLLTGNIPADQALAEMVRRLRELGDKAHSLANNVG